MESIETLRLRGERIRFEHADALHAHLYGDARVMATLGGRAYSLDEARERVRAGAQHWIDHGFGSWVFFAKDDGRLVGRGGIHRFAELGHGLLYHLAAREWGRGFATEIARASIDVGFSSLGLSSILSWTLPDNHASRKVMEKCGMRFEREGIFAGLSHVFYRLDATPTR